MCTEPGHERPTAPAYLKIVLKPLAEISCEIQVPESESRRLLDIPRLAFSVAGPVLTLLVASYIGAPWWTAVLLAVIWLIVDGVLRYGGARRSTGLPPGPELRPSQRFLSRGRPKVLN
jgi:hypothetical protein